MLLRRPPNLAFGAGIAAFGLTVALYLFSPLIGIELPTLLPTAARTEAQSLIRLHQLQPLPKVYSAEYPSLHLPPALAVYPELYLKLHAFLSRPIYGHEEAVEREVNTAKCPYAVSDRLVNPDQLNGDHEFWSERVESEEIVRRRVSLVGSILAAHQHSRPILGTSLPTHLDTGAPNRGIVITGGNKDTTLRLLTLLKILRQRLGCDLPVEVFHFPGEMAREKDKEEIRGLGATILEITDTKKDEGAWKSFNIKGLAITHSTFREVLYLDSDNIPLRDPSTLFDSPKYNSPGSGRAAFWPDLSKDHTDNAIWRVMGVGCDLDDWTFESGQILIDKAGNNGLNLAALHIAAHMQDENDFWFHLCGGDKDTFRWGFRALDLPFTRSPRWISPLGSMNIREGNRFCGHSIVQYDLDIPEGADREPPLFLHSNLLKHISGLRQGSTFTHLKRASKDAFSERTLHETHQWVRQADGRGMCTDIELWDDGAGLSEAEKEAQTILTVPLSELAEFDGFEASFFGEGGRAGGWRRRSTERLDFKDGP